MHSAPSPFPLYLLPSIPFRRRSSSATTIDTTSASGSPPTDQQSCASSYVGSSAPSSPPSSPPRFLSGHRAHLRCTRCLTDLCLTSQIISKGFTGRHGRAYLVAPPNPYPRAGTSASTSSSDSGTPASLRSENNLPNTHTHKPVPRQLVTGAHTVSDISCALCGAVLGWKYVAAEEESQKYKVGKFILETKRVCRGVCWENEAEDEDNSVIGGRGRNRAPRKKARSSVDSEGSGATGSGDGDEDDDDAIEFDSQDEDECEDLFAGTWSPALARKRRRGRLWRDARNGANGVEEV
ncbi:yippee family protein [Phyllosticta citriasiana]|uniref:yippee family protein n=1 Tax=Phyllosticta citriasiana TaxID=595635 RepID=UPI0030FDA665